MTTEASSSKTVPLLSGVAIGVVAFAGLTAWFSHPLIPTTDDLPTIFRKQPLATVAVAAPSGPTDPGEQVFTTVCAACHQANAQGLPGAFPPLAGSEWMTADAETPIRVVIHGLSGPVTVKGAAYNSMMPPPPGLDDEKIAAVLTYVRKSFGNTAAAVTKDQVASVRAALGSRSAPFTAEELTKLRPAGGGAAPAGGAAPGGGAAPAAPAAAPSGAAPAAPGGAAPAAPGGAAPAAPAGAAPANAAPAAAPATKP
jgi:mono/diheme cytochrome c family protein